MLQIIINGKQCRVFIKYAMTTCDSFSLVFEKDDADKLRYVFQDVFSALAEFVSDRKNIGDHPDTGTSFQNSDMIFYECNKHTMAILQTANTVLGWDGKTLPEELCFYRNGQKWFTCVCHEKYLFIYNETKDDIAFFKNEGIEYWQ